MKQIPKFDPTTSSSSISSMDYMVASCDLEVCRVCFATDCKLYSMREDKKLDKAYKMLTGLLIKNEDKLPPYMCTHCAHRLLNCIHFRTKSLQAHLILLDIINKHKVVTLESLTSAHREQTIDFGLSIKPVQTNQYDVEIKHDNIIENSTNRIKVENDYAFDDYENNSNPMVNLRAMHEFGENYEVKNEMDSQASLEYKLDDTKDEVDDKAKIEIDVTNNGGTVYLPNSYEHNVIEDFKSHKIKVENVIHDDGHEILIPYGDAAQIGNIMFHDRHSDENTTTSKVFEYGPGFSEAILDNNHISTWKRNLVCGEPITVGSATNKKKEHQQRYREQNREKLKQREAERRKRLQYSPSITGSPASNINKTELNNDVTDANSQQSSVLEGMQSTVQRNGKTKENNALQKKRERQQRYREQNREKLKLREMERRLRLQQTNRRRTPGRCDTSK